MENKIFENFLECQRDEGMALSEESDILDLVPSLEGLPRRYIARFSCRGLVCDRSGGVSEANQFYVGIWFPPDYLRRAEPPQVLTWLRPVNVFHPNIRAPFICVGRLSPGSPLEDLLYQVYEIITYQKATVREDDALNPVACSWARRNQARLPIDKRPLRRRVREFRVEVSDGENSREGE